MAKKTGKLRVVLAGCGGMANAWVNTIKGNSDIELVGMTDLMRKAAETLAEKHHLSQDIIFKSLGEAIAKTKPEAVFDVTIPAAHDKVVIEALKAGCHVLGEKPMSDSMDKAKKMVAAAKKSGKIYAITQNYRYNSAIAALSKFVRGVSNNAVGNIGAVEELHADFYIGAHFGGFRDEMVHPLILDMAIHTFDASRFISGCDPVAVYCHSWNPKHSWYKGDASAVAIFEMTRGVMFTYRGSWCGEGPGTPWNSKWRVIGAKGTVLWDGGDEIKAQMVKPEGKAGFISEMIDVPVSIPAMAHQQHAGLMRDFVAALRGGPKPQTLYSDNIKSLAMVHAAVQSAKTGKRVKVA